MKSNEQAETKKRKGAVKDDNKKLKKPKTGQEKEDGLTLNAAAKFVEILHIKVIHLSRKHCRCLVFPSGSESTFVNIDDAFAVAYSIATIAPPSALAIQSSLVVVEHIITSALMLEMLQISKHWSTSKYRAICLVVMGLNQHCINLFGKGLNVAEVRSSYVKVLKTKFE